MGTLGGYISGHSWAFTAAVGEEMGGGVALGHNLSSLDGSTQLQMLREGATSQADPGSAGKGSRRRWGGVVGSRLYQQEPAEGSA